MATGVGDILPDHGLGWRRGIASGLALLATVLLLGLVVAVGFLGNQRDRALQYERHSQDVILLTRSADASMARGEAALGRFVIGGRANTGSAYFFEWRGAGRQLVELRRMVARDPVQRARVDRLLGLYRQRGRELDEAATRANYKQGWSALAQFDQAGTGPTGDEIERLLRQITATQRERLTERTRETGLVSEKAGLFTDILSIFGILVGLGAIFLGFTAFRAVRQNQAALRLARAEAERAETLESAVADRTAELEYANEALRLEAEERAAAEAQLAQAQKMEAVGQLTGGIAHDFNNMLAVVVGGLDLAKRRLAGPRREVERHLDNAMEGATRAAQLTRRLLAFARSEPVNAEGVDPGQLIYGMSQLLDRTLGERINIQTAIDEDVGTVWVDPHQLENGILNLAVNARDAMDGVGDLILSARNVSLSTAEVAHLPSGDYVRIGVRDTGSGMPDHVKARAFEPFFTTKPVGKGTGLGLSQLFGFARQSGGDVIIDTAPGQGTEIALYLPQRAPVAQSAEVTLLHPPAPPQPADGTAEGARILVVEDDPRVRTATVGALEELGHAVHACSGGQEALDVLARGEAFNLVITDVIMPEMTGPELARALKTAAPELPVLFVTGYVGEAGDGEDLPADAILRKPFTVSGLETAVANALANANAPRPSAKAAARG